MKHFSKLTTLLLVFMLAFAMLPTTVAMAAPAKVVIKPVAASAASSTIKYVRFSLYGWDGPMYVDVNGVCSYNVNLAINGQPSNNKNGSLNGTWRAWLAIAPRTNNTIKIWCSSTYNHGVYWIYSVYYSGNQMWIYRTATGSF
jgi:hypothetical protein